MSKLLNYKNFKYINANIFKIDKGGNELLIFKGMNLTCKDLICVEVECTLDQDNKNLFHIDFRGWNP